MKNKSKKIYRWNSTIPIKKKVEKKKNKKINIFKKKTKKLSRSKLIKKLDKMFSDFIREKYKNKCIKCGKTKNRMGVSHYFSRRYLGTRWEVDNCHWSCWTCHTWIKNSECLERSKAPGEWYYNYMIKTLGKERFEELEKKAHTINKLNINDIENLINNFNLIYKKGGDKYDEKSSIWNCWNINSLGFIWWYDWFTVFTIFNLFNTWIF
ncbi:MAG: recombination protein NinG [Thermoplasmata archaeon]